MSPAAVASSSAACVVRVAGPAARRSGVSLARRAPVAPRRQMKPLRSVENDEAMTAEWSASWSLRSYEDLAQSITAGFELNKELADNTLGSVMSSPAITVTAETPVNELAPFFQNMSGLPVVNADGQLIGVVSKKDVSKTDGSGTVRDIMSSPPIAAKPGYKVSDGASIMLKYAVNRLPIVDENKRVIGLVSRTDISSALGNKTAVEA